MRPDLRISCAGVYDGHICDTDFVGSPMSKGLDHLFRRAGFGASQQDVAGSERLGFLGFSNAVAHLLDYARLPDDVDDFIGTPGFAGITAPGGFQPRTNIAHARQRWLFRMVHSRRPLQEKMALFWHNHFATAYSKISGELNATEERGHGGETVRGPR